MNYPIPVSTSRMLARHHSHSTVTDTTGGVLSGREKGRSRDARFCPTRRHGAEAAGCLVSVRWSKLSRTRRLALSDPPLRRIVKHESSKVERAKCAVLHRYRAAVYLTTSQRGSETTERDATVRGIIPPCLRANDS